MKALFRLPCLFLALMGGCMVAPTQAERDLALHIKTGTSLYQRGAYAEAREQFRYALSLRPDDPDLQFRLAQCHDVLKQPVEAESLYRTCLQRSPGHEGARHAYTAFLLNNDREQEARQNVRYWLAYEPHRPGPYVADGRLHLRDGDLDSARGRFHQAVDLDPVHPTALMELAQLYERLGRPGRAAHLYELAAQSSPDPTEARTRLKALTRNGGPRLRPE